MSDDFAAPVKGIIKALDVGIKLTKRISKSASHGPENLKYISELALGLQRNLEKCSEAIADAYRDAAGSCGEDFAKALMEDEAIQNRLKEVRIDLRDQIDECQDFDENLESFQPSAFTSVKQQSKRCRTECTFIFNNLRDRINRTDHHHFRMEDKSPPLSPVHLPFNQQTPSRKAVIGPPNPSTPPFAVSSFRMNIQNLEDIKNTVLVSEHPKTSPRGEIPWSLSGPYFDVGPKTPPHVTSSEPSYQESLQPTPPPRYRCETPPAQVLPANEVVCQRRNANEEVLERRQQSRMSFHNEIPKPSIEENSASETFSDGPMLSSPWSSNSSTRSPIDRHSSRGSGYDELMGRKRSQGQRSQGESSRNGSLRDRDATPESTSTAKPGDEYFSPVSLKPPTPISATSMSPGIGEYQHAESGTSLWMKSPVSPPMSEIHDPASWGSLAPTTATPTSTASLAPALPSSGLGTGVEDGLEVVSFIESGLEVVPTHDPEPVPMQASNPVTHNRSLSQLAMHGPIPSIKGVDCPMRQGSSFYKFDGFCPGAKAMVRGETGFKVIKRPSKDHGHYSATLSARCIKCAYEVGWNDVEKDRLLDRSGIYSNTGIRWRQRFISKCHLKTTSVDDAPYGCIFCVGNQRTVEDHDATVFFSVTSLFRHLARHPRPLPQVTGITAVYGIQPPSVLDFDIQFTIHEPKLSTYCMFEIASKVASRPAAHATMTHRPKPTAKTFRDPDGQPTMHFADGAKIVGITFPERFGGNWCVGYHDGERGSFPANTVSLLAPPRDEVKKNPQSSLQAVAKWDWKPKDKEEGWLKFSKGERIFNIGYAWQDQWCWSGCTAKGKWGLFPSIFVEDLISTDSSSGNAKASKILGTDIEKKERGGLGAAFGFSSSKGRMVAFPLSRNRSARGPPSPRHKEPRRERERERSGSSLSGSSLSESSRSVTGLMRGWGHRRAASLRSNGSSASTPSSPAGPPSGLELDTRRGGGAARRSIESGAAATASRGSSGSSGSAGMVGSSWLRT